MIITSNKILNYKAVLEVNGPLFIGSGKTIEKSEYITNNTRIYIMDSFKMFNGLRKKGLLEKYQNDVITRENGFNMSSFVRNNNIY